LNIGFAHTQGEYLTWTSDDNIFMNNAVEHMLRELQAQSLDFVYADIYAVQDDDFQNAKLTRLEDCSRLSKHNCVRACFLYSAKCMRRSAIMTPTWNDRRL